MIEKPKGILDSILDKKVHILLQELEQKEENSKEQEEEDEKIDLYLNEKLQINVK